MFGRILVPLDGSPASNAALPAALTVAQATGGSIVLLRVVPHAEWSEDSASRIGVALRRVATELMAAGTHAEWLVGAGEPAVEILDQVQRQCEELIVMRTHSRVGLRRAVAGSVADRVLANSSVPVLLLRTGGHRLRHIRQLFVPVDGSPGGAAALGTATKLADVNGAAIHLCEAVVPLLPFAAAYDGMLTYDPAFDEASLARARTYVAHVVSMLRRADRVVSGDACMVPGDPMTVSDATAAIAATLVSEAQEHAADLIVMSTHALTGFERAVVGSVAGAVVHAAACPVLLIRRPVKQPASADAIPQHAVSPAS